MGKHSTKQHTKVAKARVSKLNKLRTYFETTIEYQNGMKDAIERNHLQLEDYSNLKLSNSKCKKKEEMWNNL